MKKMVVSVAIWAGLCGQLVRSESIPIRLRRGSARSLSRLPVRPAWLHDFERAVALLHSFAYDAAEKAFLDVAKADPTCAMAHWGAAMSNWHQLWAPPDAEDLSKGREEIARAQQLSVQSERERQFIAAAAAFFHDSDHTPHPVRAKAYEQAMQKAARSNPKDTETQVFYALSLLATATPEDRTHANQKLAASILEPIYAGSSGPPGCCSLSDSCLRQHRVGAARGWRAARAYSKIAPSAPHALHMPSHIFTRLGLWDDSIASNIAARTACAQSGRCR